MIKKLVILHGRRKWAVVAVQLVGRSGKQCRERFKNQLDPNIKRMAWSEEEVFKHTFFCTHSLAHPYKHTDNVHMHRTWVYARHRSVLATDGPKSQNFFRAGTHMKQRA